MLVIAGGIILALVIWIALSSLVAGLDDFFSGVFEVIGKILPYAIGLTLLYWLFASEGFRIFIAICLAIIVPLVAVSHRDAFESTAQWLSYLKVYFKPAYSPAQIIQKASDLKMYRQIREDVAYKKYMASKKLDLKNKEAARKKILSRLNDELFDFREYIDLKIEEEADENKIDIVIKKKRIAIIDCGTNGRWIIKAGDGKNTLRAHDGSFWGNPAPYIKKLIKNEILRDAVL